MSNKVVVSIIGLDCPGVVYTVADTLSELECTIEEANQTILKNQFAAIVIATLPKGLESGTLQEILYNRITEKSMHLSVTIRPFETGCGNKPQACEPFVITMEGEEPKVTNRLDILTTITRLFASQQINIENMKAIRPEKNPQQCVFVFEVALPLDIDRSAFTQTLRTKAEQLNIQMSIQHRDIFEALHRVSPL